LKSAYMQQYRARLKAAKTRPEVGAEPDQQPA
jgi:hypothetical protein